ncbi:Cytosol aminopeptidase PepA [hydrothermal vent metagenome]|uniref:leucyl aminopeptidase n=1 Tax=hydrothermal vent metagenome TaxID=652676 RepID=A0A1W1CES7_9ZZZZ
MNFKLTEKKVSEIKSDLEIIIVIKGDLNHKSIKDKNSLIKAGFSGEHEESCLLIENNRFYIGSDTIKSTDIRAIMGVAMRSLQGTTFKSAKVSTYMSHPKCTAVLRGMVEGIILGNYTFDRYKSKKSTKNLTDIIISMEEYHGFELDKDSCQRAIDNAIITANATNYTRDIVNTPPEDFYPKVMAKMARELSEESSLECKILKKRDIVSEDMNALLAVSRASRHKPRVIHLSHKPENPKAVISIIGKGLTYDSGGLSLKPSDFMVNMKLDKSGGSAVMGIMKAISEMNIGVEVHGFIGAVENMIGGDAYKPDDVLVAKNGKTIEVKNTDAEGRLVLADVLCYAQQEVKADYIFDMATLTGACVVGVGNYTTGVMGNTKMASDMVVNASNKISGEMATKLDFNRYLGRTIKSNIADMSNISNTRYGGAVTAGMFLANFIDEHHKDRWAHLDIAGPAFVEHSWGENPEGASGAGVRTMIKLIEKVSRGDGHIVPVCDN